MSNEQKLTDMVDFFRTKLAEEQLRHADALTTAQALQRENESLQLRINSLEQELEGYRVQEEDSGKSSTDSK